MGELTNGMIKDLKQYQPHNFDFIFVGREDKFYVVIEFGGQYNLISNSGNNLGDFNRYFPTLQVESIWRADVHHLDRPFKISALSQIFEKGFSSFNQNLFNLHYKKPIVLTVTEIAQKFGLSVGEFIIVRNAESKLDVE